LITTAHLTGDSSKSFDDYLHHSKLSTMSSSTVTHALVGLIKLLQKCIGFLTTESGFFDNFSPIISPSHMRFNSRMTSIESSLLQQLRLSAYVMSKIFLAIAHESKYQRLAANDTIRIVFYCSALRTLNDILSIDLFANCTKFLAEYSEKVTVTPNSNSSIDLLPNHVLVSHILQSLRGVFSMAIENIANSNEEISFKRDFILLDDVTSAVIRLGLSFLHQKESEVNICASWYFMALIHSS
jgi:hypothetical protein